MSVKINNSAGGSVTLDSTTTSNEALTLPTGGGTLAKTTDIPTAGADTSLSNLSATGEQRVCQAWVNFNGTGTVAIRDSYNVSSISDNGTGNYVVHITSALANTSASVVAGGSRDAVWSHGDVPIVRTTSISAIGVRTVNSASAATDWLIVNLQVFGD